LEIPTLIQYCSNSAKPAKGREPEIERLIINSKVIFFMVVVLRYFISGWCPRQPHFNTVARNVGGDDNLGIIEQKIVSLFYISF